MNKEEVVTHKYWIRILQEDTSKLSDWEKNFVGDMAIRLMNGWTMTDAQEAKLEQIYQMKGGI